MALDINLYEKQRLALTTSANEILYGGAVGGGKALALDTPMLTTQGWKTMGTLTLDDQVFDELGNPCHILAKSAIVYDNTYRVTFNKNRFLICDGRHQWLTSARTQRQKSDFTKQLYTTKEIKDTLRAREGRANHRIDLTKPVKFSKKEQPMPAYMFGMWLAGGFLYDKKHNCLKQQAISQGSSFQITKYKAGKYTNVAEFNKLLEKTGASETNKHIPYNYMYGSVEQRIDLLQGFIDIVGSIGKDLVIELQFKTFELASAFNFIIISLGNKSRVYDFKFDSVNTEANYRLRFHTNLVLSKTTVKLERFAKNSKKMYRPYIYITNVEKIADVPKQCIQVDSPSHLYLAGKDLIPTHNSYLLRVAAIIWAMECPGLQIYLFRVTRKELEDNHMVGNKSFYDLLGDAITAKYVKVNNKDYQIQFRNGTNNSFMNGSIIHLCHCQYEKDKYNYQGAEIGVLMIDEVTHFTSTKYTYLRTRVRIPKTWSPPKSFTEKWGEHFFPRILLGSNPGGRSHNWFKKEFVKLAPPFAITQMPKLKGGMRRQFIPATLADNPAIDREEYEGRVMAVGNAATARMLLEGDWDALAGGMFDDVWDENIHMIPPFEIPSSWYVNRAFDWGSAVPFSVGWYAESDGTEVTTYTGETICYPKGTIFRVAEWYGWTGEENEGINLTGWEIGKGIKEREESNPIFRNIKRIESGPADNQIWNNTVKADSAYVSIAHEINAGYYGKESYKFFDIFIRSDKTQGSNVRGWSIVRAYLKNSLNYPKIDRRCIFFFNTCTQVSRILPTIVRDTNNLEEIAKNQEDHIMDEIKYRLTQVKQTMRKIQTRLG